MPLASPGDGPRFAKVLKTEEKGSDVNLAVHLLNDSWLDIYDCAVVVSNDGDIAESMRLVREHHNKKIGLITPRPTQSSYQLKKHADFHLDMRKSVLKRSQLPLTIPNTKITKTYRME